MEEAGSQPANVSRVGSLHSSPGLVLLPRRPASLSMRSVGWPLGVCICASGARRRENWNEWLWLGVWPAPESPSCGRRQGRTVAMAGWGPLSEKGPSVGSAQVPVILGRSGQIQRALSGLLTPYTGSLHLPHARP